MQPLTKDLSGLRRNLPVVSVVFFGLFYFFLWFCVEPRVVYQHYEITMKVPFFKTGWFFLRDCLSYPGGPSQYVAAFFTQLCYYSWLGALCITLIAWSIYRLAVLLTGVTANSPWRVIFYVPALLMLMICGRYEDPSATAVAVLFVVVFSVLYKKFSPRLDWARLILFLILSGILYYITGSAALIFIALAVLHEFFDRGKVFFCIAYLLLGAGVCWLLGVYFFELEASEAYLYSSPFLPIKQNLEKEKWARIFECVLFVILPVAVLLVNSVRKLVEASGISRPAGQDMQERPSAAEKILGRFHESRTRWLMQILLLILIAVTSVCFSFNQEAKIWIQMSDFTCRGMWPEVLAAARKIPVERYSFFCNHVVNRALYFTGRLGDRMFTYPQNYQIMDLVFNRAPRWNTLVMERTEICLELGLVNIAEKITHEFLEGSDNSPFILKQAALISIVKGQIETARVYLRVLSRNIVYKKEAEELLRTLEEDPQFESDERVRYLRSVNLTENNVCVTFDEGDLLEELLRRNRHNKMAFEYLMAHCLMTRQLDKFVENISRLDDFNYSSIPRHYQEAVLIYTSKTRKKVDLGDRKISPEVIRQFTEVNRIFKEVGYDGRAASRKLAPMFGRTYFYYYLFGVSGV